MKREVQPAGKSRSARLDRAVRSPYNLLGLSLFVAITAATLSPWPFVIGVALEVVYLAVATALGSKATDDTQSSEDRSGEVASVVVPVAVVRSVPAPAAPAPSKAVADIDCLPPADLLSGDTQGRYLRLEATFRLIQLQLDQHNTSHRDLLEQLRYLMDRFVYFAGKQDMLHERLQAIAADAKALRSPIAPSAGVVDLQLVYASGETGEYRSIDEWVHAKMKLAHDSYEQALRDVAWRRQERVGEAPDVALDTMARHLLRCNKNVDRIGKTLLNLHYELQLLDKRFSMTSEEISTRRFEQVLADIKALVLQTQSLTRTVEDIEPFESASEYAAA